LTTSPSKGSQKKLSKNQYYQLLGLVTASHHLEQQDYLLYDSFASIVGKDNADNWFWGIRSDEQFKAKLDKVLKQEGFLIEK
jgi:hypothetical protein